MHARRRDLVRSVDRKPEGGRPAAAVRVHHDVAREQGDQPVHVAGAGRLAEALEQLPLLPGGRPEARTRPVDVLLGAPQELPGVRLGQTEHHRDLGVLVVEDLVQQEDRPLAPASAAPATAGAPWRQTRRPGRLGRRRFPGSVTSGSGSHSPTYDSRRARADSSWLTQRRLTIVTRNARGDRMSASEARCQRRKASWRTSSASATLPSMRYAIEKRSPRCSSKSGEGVRAAVAVRARRGPFSESAAHGELTPTVSSDARPAGRTRPASRAPGAGSSESTRTT